MLLLLILAVTSASVMADIIHFYRLFRRHRRLPIGSIVWAAVTDMLPIAIIVGNSLIHDNSTAYMASSMWIFWAWLVTVTPRLAYYFFNLLHLPRVGIAAGALIVAVLVWGATLGRTRLHVNRVEICSDQIPAAFEGFRIVQLSDIHLGTVVCPGREMQRLVDRVATLKPDLIVFTGDLVNVRPSELTERAARILGSMKAPCGIVSVTGNHDVGAYIKDTISLPRATCLEQVIARQRAMGWNVLNDTTIYLVRGSDSISLSGIAYDTNLGWRRHDRQLPPARLETVYRDVPDTLFNITAAHLPQLWDQICATNYGDLTLSGHVHGMQMKLRLFGHEYSPAQLTYDRWSGRYDDNGRTLYINDGTGYVGYPMRLGAWPEITLFTLRRCE